jgi:hypothetical protein
MRKNLIFCLLALLPFYIKAQQGPGQFVISAGAGYSPGFDGQVSFISQTYPTSLNPDIEDGDNGFTCYGILPNIGATVDYGITPQFSIGLAGSYQSEMVTYELPPTYIDQVSRTNAAIRFLLHLSKHNMNVDDYFGLRFGMCYWHDTPSSQNTIYNTTVTFLANTSYSVASLQVLYGIRLYMSDNVSIHLEVGIGQPYLAEMGLSYRLGGGDSGIKISPSHGPKPDDDYGHPVIKQ